MNDIQFTAIPLQNPLYKEVKRQIMAELISGEWKPGMAIPAEKRLSERFAVSIGTIRKAIDELVAENILIRQQGRGTFVATHNRDRLLFYFFHIVGHDGTKQYPVVALNAFAKGKAEADEAVKLGIHRGDPVFRIRNILKLANAPVIVDDIVIDQRRFPGLTENSLPGGRTRSTTFIRMRSASAWCARRNGCARFSPMPRTRGCSRSPPNRRCCGLRGWRSATRTCRLNYGSRR